jgi:translation initiation factor IF-2
LNWEVLGFNPELSSAVRAQGIEAIEIMRGQYVLAPFVYQSRKRQKIKQWKQTGAEVARHQHRDSSSGSLATLAPSSRVCR